MTALLKPSAEAAPGKDQETRLPTPTQSKPDYNALRRRAVAKFSKTIAYLAK